jgi:hypothetical protein
MIFRHLTGFSRKYSRISKGALEGSSSTNSREINPPVGTDDATTFHAFTIPFRESADLLEKEKRCSSSPLIQISSLRRNNNVLTSVISNPLLLMSCYTINRVLSDLASSMIRITSHACPTHQTPNPFYITLRRQKNPALRQNYVSELQQEMIDDPASFESGSDLLYIDGQPWSRPLCVLPRYYNPLYKKLREDRLVPDDLDAILSTSTSKLPRYRGSQRLYTLNDSFIVDFSYTKLNLFVITEQGIEVLLFRALFYESYGKILPYTGAYTNRHLSILLD